MVVDAMASCITSSKSFGTLLSNGKCSTKAEIILHDHDCREVTSPSVYHDCSHNPIYRLTPRYSIS